ncbi:hypothetical protein FANTH_1980 [Fusarium anthophilum]|uniref:F-box domain-containing protein n=1 Tax=Fusarium anthophilum TaxID=48485 RepID=A0A8H4ZUZ2_9HYPO|nr:hypothetical protein FANTH_1980 [Fusarium anthophilum]
MMPHLPSFNPDGIDQFGTLPLELNVNIMTLLTLDDLLSLTRASPAALRLLTHLRYLRSRLKGKSRLEVEKQLKPVSDSILLLAFMDIPSGWDSNLQAFIAAQKLIPELWAVFDIWKNRIPSESPDQELDKIPRWECWRFVESFLRFECGCCLLYHPEGFMFQDMLQLQHVFLKPLASATETTVPSDLRPWGLVEEMIKELMIGVYWTDKRSRVPIEFNFRAPNYFRSWFEAIIKGVDRSLHRQRGRAKKGRTELTPSVEESEILRFLQRKRSEHRYLCYHLTLQGNTLLDHLLALTPQDLNDYILDTYLSVAACPVEHEPKYHPDLEEMKFIEENWQCD